MANIAAIFHWSLASLEAMTVEDLADWHALAIERSGTDKD
jgi:hypothetical protein